MTIAKRITAGLLALAFSSGTATAPFAAQSSDGFSVRVTRLSGCTVVATDVNFGTVTTVTNGMTAQGQIVARCTLGTFMFVSFNGAGFYTGATTGNMTGATAGNTDTIPYRLQLSGCCATGQGINVPITGTINGTITANVNATPDSYRQTRTLYMYF